MKHRIFLLATALMLAFSLFMAVPSAGIPLSAGLIVSHDGAIMPGEYSDTTTFGGSFELHWRNTGKDIHIAMKAPTSGWVSIGLQPGPQSAADMILGYYSGGTAYIYDMFASSHLTTHEEDSVLGGTGASYDIAEFGGSEQGGYTIIEFRRKLYTHDIFDRPFTLGINKIIWAYGPGDNNTSGHTARGSGEIVIPSPAIVETNISLKAGWNMVSVPLIPQDNSTATVFKVAEAVYTWDPATKSYYSPATIEPNKGYWVAVSNDIGIGLTGTPAYEWTAGVIAGWNMVGSAHDLVCFNHPEDSIDGSVEAFAYWWNPTTKSYDFTTTLESNKGYWIAATQSCTLNVGTTAGHNACGSTPIFTTSPLDTSDIVDIVPLGNLNPPGHVFPTDHIYLYMTTPHHGAAQTNVATLYSPGDLVVTELVAVEHVNAGFTDYSLTLRPCPDVRVVFGHVTSLATEIFGDTSSYTGWTLQSEYSTGGETYRRWRKNCYIPVSAGDILGTAGGRPGQWALDLGVYDMRYRIESVANLKRWMNSQYLYTACPLNYYEAGPVLDELLALVKRIEIEGDPYYPCGAILQDVPGTAQGCWFLSGVDGPYPEDFHLALVHSNYHPSYADISTGNSITGLNSGVYEFLPESSGLLNRDFKDITPDGKTYGFQTSWFSGIIIVQMPDAETLWIEALSEATTDPASWIFTPNKTVFER